ncbi:MAG: GNAT family N-acetyltransferase [Candidatus Odinarchaeota archaeon]
MTSIDWELLDKMLKVEIECFSSFTNVIKKEWGFILYNGKWKDRHDANHAKVLASSLGDDFIGVIEEISLFYRERGLIPRIYFEHPDKNHPFKETLRNKGFINPEYADKNKPAHFMTYLRKDNPPPVQMTPFPGCVTVNGSDIEPESWIGKDIEKVLLAEWEYQKIIKHPDYRYFVLYLEGEPVSILSFFTSSTYQSARLDDVLTQSDYRNRGFASLLLNHAMNWAYRKKLDMHLYVSEENAKRIYQRAGFKDLVTCFEHSWFLQKSVENPFQLEKE